MTLANVKLVVTDMDGTLLNTNHQVSPLFFKLFKKLKQQHIKFVVATGRPYYSVLEKLHPIKDDIIIVAENGGIVIQNNEIIHTSAMKKSSLHSVSSLLNTIPDINIVFCTKNKAYTTTKSDEVLKLIDEYFKNPTVINDVKEITDPIFKISLYHKISSEKYLYPQLKQLEGDFKVKISENHWLDISENNANKGYAIELIQKKYGVTPKETLVFGDYNNDIEMLQAAHFSYAMENAHPFVKETANFITKNNDNFGVEVILEQLLKDIENL